MKVIRCGKKPGDQKRRWSDIEVLQAFWQMEEERGGRPNPMNAMPVDIPQLTPVPVKVQERSNES